MKFSVLQPRYHRTGQTNEDGDEMFAVSMKIIGEVEAVDEIEAVKTAKAQGFKIPIISQPVN